MIDAAWVVTLGIVSGVISFLVFRRSTDPEQLRQTANRIVAHLFEIQLFGEEPRLVLRAQRDLIVENGRILLALARPILLLLIPFAVLLWAMEGFFGHALLRPGEATLITTQINKEPSVPPGVKVDRLPVYVTAEHCWVWQVRAEGADTGNLRSERRTHWLWWFGFASVIGAIAAKFVRVAPFILLCLPVGLRQPL